MEEPKLAAKRKKGEEEGVLKKTDKQSKNKSKAKTLSCLPFFF